MFKRPKARNCERTVTASLLLAAFVSRICNLVIGHGFPFFLNTGRLLHRVCVALRLVLDKPSNRRTHVQFIPILCPAICYSSVSGNSSIDEMWFTSGSHLLLQILFQRMCEYGAAENSARNKLYELSYPWWIFWNVYCCRAFLELAYIFVIVVER